ncbi:autotransporter outer membrane beta-barrel domain-containing protein [Martelella soudanensis]|uniref:autotransporter outer membrane beta-barrel domain-containing protein n=1 Tax=unclassified Martelella TaxID=2629616 RepID=UPI0015DD554E|nr:MULTISPECIES: autotransporter outer membrane beta-barrel domain-containing protein [unclassified Martelella]
MTLSDVKLRGGRMTKIAGTAASYAPRGTASVLALSMLALSSGATYFGTGVSSAFAANECGAAGGPNAVIECTGNKPNGITYNNLQGATVTLNSPSMKIGNGLFNTRGVRLTSTGGNALTFNADSYDRIYWPVVLQGDGEVAANFSGGTVTSSLSADAVAITLTSAGAVAHAGTVILDGTTINAGNILASGNSAVIINGNADGSVMTATITGGSSIDIEGGNSFGVRLRGSGAGNSGMVIVDGASDISAYQIVSLNTSKATAISVETSGASSMGYVSLSGDADVSASATNSIVSSVSTGVSNKAGDGGVNTIVDNATLTSSATSLLTSTAFGIDNQSTGGTAEATVKGAGSVSVTANSFVSLGDTDQASSTAIRNVSDTQGATVYVAENGTVTSEATITFGNAIASGVINNAGLGGGVVLDAGAITATASATTLGAATVSGVINSAGLDALVFLNESTIAATASGTGLIEAVAVSNMAADGLAGVGGSASTLSASATSSLGQALATAVDNIAVLGDAAAVFDGSSQISATANGASDAQAVAIDSGSQQGDAAASVDGASTVNAEASSANSYAVASAVENRAEKEARIRVRGGSTITSTAMGAASAGLGGFAAKSTGLLNASTAGDASTVIDDMSGVSAQAFSTVENTSAMGVNNFTSLGTARTVVDNGSNIDALTASQLDSSAVAVSNSSDNGESRVDLDNQSSVNASADSEAGSASATGIANNAVDGNAIVLVLGGSEVSVGVSGSDVYAYGVTNMLSGAGVAGFALDEGSTIDVGTLDQATATASVVGVNNVAKGPLGSVFASIKGMIFGSADAVGAAEVYGVMNAAQDGDAVIGLSDTAEIVAEAMSAADTTAVAVDNTTASGDAMGVAEGASRLTAYAQGDLVANATGFNNASASGNAWLSLDGSASVSASAISNTASAEAKALDNLATDGNAYVELLGTSLASADASGVTATARAVANEVHGAGEASLKLDAGSTLLATASASDLAMTAAATNFADDAGGSASALLAGLISVSADGDDEVNAGGVWNSAEFGDVTMGVAGTSVITIDSVSALDAYATGLRNMTRTGGALLTIDAGAGITVSATGTSDAEATGAENLVGGDNLALSDLGGTISAVATGVGGEAEAIGLTTNTEGAGDAVSLVRSTASVTATATDTTGFASAIGVSSESYDEGDAYVEAAAGASIKASASGDALSLAIGLGALSELGDATVTTAADIVVDATLASSAGDINAAGAIAQVNNGGVATLTMTGGSIVSTASVADRASGLITFTRGAGATYAVNALGGSVLADIGIMTDSEAGQTGTIMIGADAAITSSGGHDGKALVDLDGSVTVTTTGTVVGSAMLGAGDDTFNLVGGSWTGDIFGQDGDDAFNWTGGALNSGFYGAAGNDTAYLSGGAIYDGTEVFDGGDGVDTLTFDGVSATTAGSLVTNWETFNLDNTMLTLTGGAITVGSTSVATQGIYLNGSTLQVNESTVFNGNMFLNSGSTLSSVDGATGDAMTVTGNLTGGGTLAIDVDLANALGDTLTVNGAYLGGVTTLSLNELSTGYASGAPIEIITLDGGETGAFVLPGYNVSGAYAYDLTEVGNQYFLTGDFSNATPVYEVLPELMLTLNRPDSLQDRVGERYWNLGDVSDPGYVWADFSGGREHYDGSEGTLNASYDADIYRLRMGVDGQFGENESGFAVGGLVFQYANATADVSSRVGGGDLVTQLFGFGATMTWYGNNGFYVDGQAFGNVISNDITIGGAPSLSMKQSYGYSLSAETGFRFDVAPGWAVTPQAQLSWGSVNFDDFTGVYNEDVSQVDGDSLAVRMGLETDRRTNWTTATGEARSASFNGIANVYYDLTDDPSEVRVSGVNMSTDDGDWTGEIGIGGTYTWLNGKLGINGDLTASTGLENFGDSYGLTGKVRFQMQW